MSHKYRPTLKASGYEIKPTEGGCETARFSRLEFLARGFEPVASTP